jgi:glutamyl-tRNA reductase
VLWGAEAQHHLLRTACGLNSDLPGDRDVSAQLETARRIAQCAGTVGPRATQMVEDARAVADDIHARTSWGRFSTGYCEAALARVSEEGSRPLDELQHVVIGGSTTSRSVLTALTERLHVPHRQMTVVYRDHHGQMKQLRCAVGCGTRLRVHAYWDKRVLQSIATADMVYLGIDQPDPVIDVDMLQELRDFRDRPLTIVDFNSFGSISGTPMPEGVTIWSNERLDQALHAHAAITTTRVGFSDALDEAEQWITAHMSGEHATPAVAASEGG